MSEPAMVLVSRDLVFHAACAGIQDARLLLDEMEPIGPCEYCAWDLKGQRGHFFGCPRWPDGEIAGSSISLAKDAFMRGEIDADELGLRVDSALQRSVVGKAMRSPP